MILSCEVAKMVFELLPSLHKHIIRTDTCITFT